MPKQAVKFLFQRIIHNDFQWTRPSPGRRVVSKRTAMRSAVAKKEDMTYVEKNGFGLEDWNFNRNLLIDGHIYGYSSDYEPSEKDAMFNIAFATYSKANKQWYLVGFYKNCEFVSDPPIKKEIVTQKARDLLQLGESLKPSLRDETRIYGKIQGDSKLLQWRIKPENMSRTNQPIPIGKFVYVPKTYRISKPTEINAGEFEKLHELAINEDVLIDYADESEFPEGKEIESVHKRRERNQAVVNKAKIEFKAEHGRLRCQICNFDFERVYGDIGKDYIEAHHTVPISTSKGEVKTEVTDLAMVCANCHRMLHRRRPWLTMEELAELLAKPSKPCEDEN